jgi:hypothetical protein
MRAIRHGCGRGENEQRLRLDMHCRRQCQNQLKDASCIFLRPDESGFVFDVKIYAAAGWSREMS